MWGVCDTPLRPGTGGPSKNDSVFVPFGAACGAYSIRPYDRVCAALQKTIPFSSPSGPWSGAYSIRPYDRVRTILRNTDAILQPGTCGPSKNDSVFVPFGATCGAYAIRPYDWVCAILRNTDAIPQPSTCGPSKNYPVFVSFGAVCGAYAIRPYNRVRAILRNTDAILQLGMCEGSKNGSVYATVGGVWWGVCNTSLQPGTYDPSKYRCDSPTGYGWPFKKQSRFRPSRDRGVGRMRYAPTTGYVRSFEILTQCPNRVCAILRNTDAIPQPDTRDPSKYRWDLSTGGAGVFGRWGDGGYRLRGRRV